MFELFTDNYILYIIFLIIFLISGFVKGVTGIGLPLTSIALLTFFINPLQAIGLNMIPVIVANFQQYISAESPMNTAKKYKVFASSWGWKSMQTILSCLRNNKMYVICEIEKTYRAS